MLAVSVLIYALSAHLFSLLSPPFTFLFSLYQIAESNAEFSQFNCVPSQAYWNSLQTDICSSTGVAGAISLSTCICFLFAICVLPGVCIGIIGYKRFDPLNISETPISAVGAAPSPRSKTYHGDGGTVIPAVPSTPAQPHPATTVNVDDVELTPFPHRQSLEMALSSAPQAAPDHAHPPPISTPVAEPGQAVYNPEPLSPGAQPGVSRVYSYS